MKNIFVAIDFNKESYRIALWAGRLAEKFSSKVWLVHIAAPEPDFVGYEPGPQYIRDFRADELRKEHRMLQDLALELSGRSIDCEALLIQGPTVEMILEEANKLQADIIVCGNHHRSFLHNAFLGNTSLDLFRKSEIPVLSIPLPEEENDEQ